MEVDYLKILKAYIKHVALDEGSDFLGDSQGFWGLEGLSDEENKALEKARDAIDWS